MKRFVLLGLVGLAAFTTQARAEISARCPADIVQEKELFIKDLSVVNDPRATEPGGPWTFGYLMSQMSPRDMDPSDFVYRWLMQWKDVKSLNQFQVTPRYKIDQIISFWPKKNGKLDLDHSPFRLLAIVDRIDILNSFAAGGAGEARFVFAIIRPDGVPLPFTVILEYLQPLIPSRGMDLAFWANAWHSLGSMPFGPQFNARLQVITDLFSKRGAYPGKVNGSALNQVRTNEVVLAPTWEMREFALDRRGALSQRPVRQNPEGVFNNNRLNELENYLQANSGEVMSMQYVLPDYMLGATAGAPFSWALDMARDPAPLPQVRSNFAGNTCNGCHTAETGTGFLHVSPRYPNVESTVSNFIVEVVNGKRTKNLQDLLCGRFESIRPEMFVH